MATRKKRKHPRARAKGLSVLLSSAGGVTPCAVEDVSLGGAFFRTNDQLLPGAQITITLVKSGMRRGLKLPSTVVNLRPPGEGRPAGVGVRFDLLTEEAHDRLAALLTEFGVANPEEREEDAAADPEPLSADSAWFAAPGSGSGSVSHRGAEASGGVVGRPFLPSYQGVDADPDELSDPSLSPELDAAIPKVPPAHLTRAPVARPDIGLMERLKQQLQALLVQLNEAEERLATRDSEIEALRRRVAELEKALGQRDLLIAKLRASSGR